MWGIHGPKKTACMMRPGRNVNSPAMTSAPVKMLIMARRRLTRNAMVARMQHRERQHDQGENREQMDRAPRPPNAAAHG